MLRFPINREETSFYSLNAPQGKCKKRKKKSLSSLAHFVSVCITQIVCCLCFVCLFFWQSFPPTNVSQFSTVLEANSYTFKDYELTIWPRNPMNLTRPAFLILKPLQFFFRLSLWQPLVLFLGGVLASPVTPRGAHGWPASKPLSSSMAPTPKPALPYNCAPSPILPRTSWTRRPRRRK